MKRAVFVFIIVAALAGSGFLFLQPRWKESRLPVLDTDILVYGSSLGGTSAAITAAEHGARVIFATDAATVGGQAVEAGISAFDDLGQSWEQWGLYADLQKFLREKYGTNGDRAGLGESVTGHIASIPADIEEFFLDRIRRESRLTFLPHRSLLSLKRNGGKLTEAVLEDDEGARSRVRFRYLVDGTDTGKIIAKSGTPFRLGFDSREETNELLAPPEAVRAAFVSGTTRSGATVGNLGNRVQAVTAPFILADRGFPGNFFPADPPGNGCTASGESFVQGAVLGEISDTCTTRIPLQPEFSDTYDAFLIHHGGDRATITLTSSLLPDLPLRLTIPLSTTGSLTFIGTFPFAPDQDASLSVTTDSVPFLLEGVLLLKKNLRPAPQIFRTSLQSPLMLAEEERTTQRADLYVLGRNLIAASFRIRGEEQAAVALGPEALKIPDVSLSKPFQLSLPEHFDGQVTAILALPTFLAFDSRTFQSDAPDREIPPAELEKDSSLSDTGIPVREWRFTAPESGETFFTIGANKDQWRRVELWQDEPAQRIAAVSFLTHDVTRGPRPVFSAVLKKGAAYRLRIGLVRGQVWDSFSWTMEPAVTSPILATSGPAVGPAAPRVFEGIYDLWFHGTRGTSVNMSIGRPSHLDARLVFPATSDQYEYAGKAFLDATMTLSTDTAGAEILAVPNPAIDVFAWSGMLPEGNPSLTLATLPAGTYRMALRGGPPEAQTLSGTQLFTIPKAMTAGEWRELPDALVSDGSGVSFVFSPGFAAQNVALRFYETIPDTAQSWAFGMNSHPLAGGDEAHAPLFAFRNIVAPSWMLRGKPEGHVPFPIARNTQGMTIVVNPSNDLPILAEKLDAADVNEAARALSSSYAYWMRYDAYLTRENLGCDPQDVLCSPKRTRVVFGLFKDPRSMFPPQPYIREGRRLIAQRTVTAEDLGVRMGTCAGSACPAGCREIPALPGSCATEEQEPLLFPDALAPVGYAVDLHAFHTLNEYFTTIRAFRTAMGKDPLPRDALTLLTEQWFHPYARLAEVPLHALLPAKSSNLLPASHTIGLTQISNGLFRTHVGELAIGQSVGRLLSFCLAQNIVPESLTGSAMKTYQHTLIDDGVPLFPVALPGDDPLLTRGVQHLMVEGLLTPRARLAPGPRVAVFGTVTYTVETAAPVDEADAMILKLINANASSRRDLVLALWSGDEPDNATLKAFAGEQHLFDAAESALPVETALAAPPSKGDLYRAVALLRKDRWTIPSEGPAASSTAPSRGISAPTGDPPPATP